MKILILSVHPDDETLGCGGTILRLKEQGAELHWLIVTEAHPPQWSEETIQTKAQEVERVAAAYQFSSVQKLHFPTVRLDVTPQAELIAGITQAVKQIRPEAVYLIHDGDVHTDHHAVFVATLSVLKTFYMRSLGVRRVLSYETLSSTEAAPPQHYRAFIPNVFHDITPYMENKIDIMALYATEAQPDPFPRGGQAIRALARYRGASIGVDYAEAFMLIREVD